MAENEKMKQADAKKDKGDKKPAKKSKPGIFARIKRWCKETKAELKKVQWPTWKQTWNNTLTVIVCVILVGIFIWAFDWVARLVIRALPALVQAIKG